MSNVPNTNMALWEIMTPVEDIYKTSILASDGKLLTSVKAYEAIRRMTQVFGPIGYGWGVKVLETLKQGVTFQMRVELWYKPHCFDSAIPPTEIAHVEAWGGTDYHDNDWDMAKKAMTNAMSKGISFLGFASDIYLESREQPPSSPPSPSTPPPTKPRNGEERNILAHDWDGLAQFFIDTQLPHLEGYRYQWRFVKDLGMYAFSLRNVPSGASQEVLRSAGFKVHMDEKTRAVTFYVHVHPDFLLSLEQTPEFLQFSASRRGSSLQQQ